MAIPTSSITIDVAPEVAAAYAAAAADQRDVIRLRLEAAILRTTQPRDVLLRDLQQTMQRMADDAHASGLTDTELDALLREVS